MLTQAMIQSFYGLPPQKVGALQDRTASGATDTYSAARTVNYRKRVPSRNEIARGNFANEDVVSAFSIYDDGSDPAFLPPQPEGRMTDAEGGVWRIRLVSDKCLETLHAITCTKLWS